MDLESLKKAMEAAQAALEAAKDDKDLQAQFDEAKKAYDDAVAAQASDDIDEAKLDDKSKAYIAKLRKEAASHRTKSKDLMSKLKVSEEQKQAVLKAIGIEPDAASPEERLKNIQDQNQTLAFRASILEAAVAHGVGKDDVEYFEFLVAKKATGLQEGDELTEDDIAALAKDARRGKGKANTSVGSGDGKGGGNPPPKTGDDTVTLTQFIGMSITQKSALYEKNQALYLDLMSQAKKQKKLV